MPDLILKPGDIFCTKNPMWLGKAITLIEKFQAKDNTAEYSHAGIITDTSGISLEALWTIRPNHINNYVGDKVLIGRWSGMNDEAFGRGLEAIKRQVGGIYPLWRLFLFTVPPLAKYVSNGDFAVCSELACKFLMGAGVTGIGRWQDQSPEDVADMIHQWREFSVIYEGVWQKYK